MQRVLLVAAALWLMGNGLAEAQIIPSTSENLGSRTSTLQDTLVNNLHATLPEQRQFLQVVRTKVDEGKLELRLVLAVMRYSQRRHNQFPFPYFERAMRYQAAKEGVSLPASFTFLSSRGPLQ